MMDDNEADFIQTILARNALRKEAQLPQLDLDAELKRFRMNVAESAASERYVSLCHTYAQEREYFRKEIIEKARTSGNATFPNGYAGNHLLHTLVNKRFEDFIADIERR